MTEAVTTLPAGGRTGAGTPGWLLRAGRRLVAVTLGVLLALTPLTAVLVLGWLARYTRRATVIALMRDPGAQHARVMPEWPTWVRLHAGDRGIARRTLGGLALNASLGAGALVSLSVVTAPHGLAWMAAWWAGWENSFNKGYEQSSIGALIALTGVVAALVVLTHLPLALAHQCAERRVQALFELHRVREIVLAAGWSNVRLALLYLLASLPVLAATAAPVFIEDLHADFAKLDEQGVEAFRARYRLWATAYLFLALLVLRRAAGRAYAHAARRLVSAAQPDDPWRESFAAEVMRSIGSIPTSDGPARRGLAGRALRALLCAVLWFGFVAGLFVGQFFNHDWPTWINHPLLQLPWFAAV